MARRRYKRQNDSWANLAVFFSVLFTLPVLTHTLTLVQWYGVWGAVGAPRTIAILASLSLAVYAWMQTRQQSARYVLIIVFTVNTLCLLVWLFGITSVGHFLAGPKNIL